MGGISQDGVITAGLKSVSPMRYSVDFKRYREFGGLLEPLTDFGEFFQGSFGDWPRYYFLCLILDQIQKENIAGPIAELGVYKGYSANFLAKIARRFNKTTYLFDTFEGFDARDLQGIDIGRSAGFTDTSLDAVKAVVGEEGCIFVKSPFENGIAVFSRS
jgi:hypothetical protein